MIGLLQITNAYPRIHIVGSGPWAKKVTQVLEKSSLAFSIHRSDARHFIENTGNLNLDGSIIWLATRPMLQLSILESLSKCPATILLDKPVVNDLRSLNRLKELKLRSRSNFRMVQTWRCSQLWAISFSPLRELHSIQIERNYVESREYISPTLDWLPHDFSLLLDMGLRPTDFSIDSLRLEGGKEFRLKALLPLGVEIHLSISKGDKRKSKWKLFHKSGFVRTIDFEGRVSSLDDLDGREIERWNQTVTEHPIEHVVTFIDAWGDLDFQNLLEYYQWYFELGGI